MSNGDDVLDDWEEIDEVRLNNTLQKIEAVRKTQHQQQDSYNNHDSYKNTTAITRDELQKPMKLLQRAQNSATAGSGAAVTVGAGVKSPLDDMAASFQPVMMVLHKSDDEYQAANYQPAINSQTVKILRRPTQSSEPRNNNGMRPKQPIKTLQQREQEYAEARLRILGAAKNPEDDAAAAAGGTPTSNSQPASAPAPAKVSATPKTPSASVGYNNHFQQQSPQTPPSYYFQQQHIQQQLPAYYNRTPLVSTAPAMNLQQQQSTPPSMLPLQQTWSPIVGGSVSSPMLRQQQQQQSPQQLLPVSQQESVLRLPRGPDGSNGFQMRR